MSECVMRKQRTTVTTKQAEGEKIKDEGDGDEGEDEEEDEVTFLPAAEETNQNAR